MQNTCVCASQSLTDGIIAQKLDYSNCSSPVVLDTMMHMLRLGVHRAEVLPELLEEPMRSFSVGDVSLDTSSPKKRPLRLSLENPGKHSPLCTTSERELD